MTGDVHRALVERAKRDELLNPMLGKFDNRAAIFGYRPTPLPEGQWKDWPFLVIEPATASDVLEDKTSLMAELFFNTFVYARNIGDPAVVAEPADYVYESLWDDNLEVPGFAVSYHETSPAVDASTPEFAGRVVVSRIGIRRV